MSGWGGALLIQGGPQDISKIPIMTPARNPKQCIPPHPHTLPRYLRVCRLDLTIPGRTGHSLARGSPSARRSRRFAKNPSNKPSINDGDRPQLPRSTPAYPGEVGRGMFMFCNGWCAPPNLHLVILLLLLFRNIVTFGINHQARGYKHNTNYDCKISLPLQWELKGWVVHSLS